MSEARSAVDAQQAALNERDGAIKALQENISEFEKDLANVREQKAVDEAAIEELRAALEAMRNAEAPRAQALEESQQTIGALREELAGRLAALDAQTERCEALELRQERGAEKEGGGPLGPDAETALENAAAPGEAPAASDVQGPALTDRDDTVEELQAAFGALEAQLREVKSESTAHREGMKHAMTQMNKVMEERDRALHSLEAIQDGRTDVSEGPSETVGGEQNKQQRILLADAAQGGGGRPLGELLVKGEAITEEQLEEALKEQRKDPNRLLGDILIAREFSSEACIAQAISCQLDLPLLTPTKDLVESDAALFLDKDVCTWHLCIPMRVTEDSAVIAMANPLDSEAIEKIEKLTGCAVSPVVATPTEILTAIEDVYGLF